MIEAAWRRWGFTLRADDGLRHADFHACQSLVCRIRASAKPNFCNARPFSQTMPHRAVLASQACYLTESRVLHAWEEFLFCLAVKLWSVLVARIVQRPAWAQLRTCHHPFDLVYSFCKNSFQDNLATLHQQKATLLSTKQFQIPSNNFLT